MGGVVWTNGGPLRTIQRIEAIASELEGSAPEIVHETVEEAHDNQVAILRAAVTETGRRRMTKGQGNGPGRDDTGELIADTTTEYTSENDSEIGVWGWFNPGEKEYAQEFGFNGIPAAHSINQSFIAAREKFTGRIKRLMTKAGF